MELNEALASLAELEEKLYAYQAADSALYLDGTTVAPKGSSQGRLAAVWGAGAFAGHSGRGAAQAVLRPRGGGAAGLPVE